jgi:short-chain fatty acids transporter
LSFVSTIAAIFNWGLSVVSGGILARVMSEENKNLNPSLLAAAGYSGLLVWHGGLSGSAPLDLASTAGIPLSKTILSPLNIFVTCSLVVATPIFFLFLGKIFGANHQKFSGVEEIGYPAQSKNILHEKSVESKDFSGQKSGSTADKIFNTPLWSLLFFFISVFVLIKGIFRDGIKFINLYSIIFFFIFLGMLLHLRPLSFLKVFSEGVGIASGIIIQFPFYAGIMSLTVSTGLAQKLSEFFVNLSYFLQGIFPFFAVSKIFSLSVFLSSSLLNIFIPSGGGQWKVQSVFTIPAGEKLGVSPDKICMLIAFGDEFTNMIQPFWAIPILGIVNIKAGELIAFTSIYMLFSLPFFVAGILIFT